MKRLSPAGAMLLVWCLVLLLGGQLVTDTAGIVTLSEANQLPSARHWLGTDALGRDLLANLLVGGRTALGIGFLAAVGALVLGAAVGMLGAYRGGWLDAALMRLLDTMRAVPTLLLLLFWQSMAAPSLWNVTIILVLVGWLYTARVIRSETLELKEREHVLAAKMMGLSDAVILVRHILPYASGRLRILFLMEFSGAMVMETSISFLGLGLPANIPSPGTMLHQAMSGVLSGYWWQAALPGMVLVVTLCLLHACVVSIKKKAV